MIAEDRELLSRLSTANARMGDLVARLLGPGLAAGRPDPEAMCDLADELDALATGIRARAHQIENTYEVDGPAEVEPPH